MNSLPVLPLRTRYYSPSRDTWVLAILDALSRDCDLSQRDLAKRLGLSGAVINQHLHELQGRGLLRFESRNAKSYRYVLTPEGEQLHAEMASCCSSEAIHIYTALKYHVRERLRLLAQRNLTRIVLFGASETCEVALSALALPEGLPLQVVALVDNDPAKQGTLFHGHVVSPPHVLETLDCHAVLITSFGRQGEIREQLTSLCRARGLEMVSL
ncbi:winged helix-turn-helix transcriptional regulator [Megalodesulfovibrio gigas]|uniref:Bacterial regulatory protein, arsR family n=1 Tax=Megalodesulfovibrio gigas (strain ATCC 19364 / DSM 1382 / NCIMB 9332 / VKM B-1759) TaxID=1121448 RepID=T2GGC7_MEGG1|nr:winged helix-turn-helix transcriptional regulator [Megalodesulfovibrio gigas]AGW15276.1 Bacterial regulatory protein, arsR family [Megalodesulfovibrio gigas DSM 1382 = ATCC 19364]